MIKKKWFKITIIAAAVCVLFGALSCAIQKKDMEQDVIETESIASKNGFNLPELTDEGGYEIDTEDVYCIVSANKDHKYSKFDSKSGKHSIEFYASPTEIVVIESNGDKVTYYNDTIKEENKDLYKNPLIAIYDDLRELNFTKQENKTEDGLDLYKAKKITTIIDQKQIEYVEHNIRLEWIDDQAYIFSYYEYADGSTLFSTGAPEELDPEYTKNPIWKMDIENQKFVNIETKEEINFAINKTSTGKAVSPNDKETTTREEVSYVNLYINPETKLIEKMNYEEDGSGVVGTNVNILNDVNIQRPEITDDMKEMSVDDLQLCLTLIGMIESLL